MSKKVILNKPHEIAYELGDIVLAKIRGFPAWPAQIVDPDNVPKDVAKERPGGKKSTVYCVRFFPAGDHSWVPPKDLSKLKRHEIEAYINEPHKKSGELLEGYRIALDPSSWEREIENKRAAAEEAAANMEVDELEGEEEADDDDEPAKAKKRKRDSESGPKSKSRPKKEKETGEATSKKKKSSERMEKPAKSRKNGSKSKEAVESEDEGVHAEQGVSRKKASPPPAKKSKHDKEEDGDAEMERDPTAIRVRELRHKLQRAFLSKAVPKAEDMPNLDGLFSQVEELDVEIKYLQYSKIGKVMRHISALHKDKVPRDDEFKFKDRAHALVDKWHTVINQPNGSAEPTKPTGSVPPTSAANGSVNAAPSVVSDVQTVPVPEEKKPEENAGEQQPQPTPVPGIGDTTIADTTLGDVTMSEVAA